MKYAVKVINNVKSNGGGDVSYIDMDEPWFAGELLLYCL